MRVLRGLVFILALAMAPWPVLRMAFPIYDLSTAPKAETALIFGAVVRGNTISPLHAERLDAGAALLAHGTVDRVVVSNQARAAGVMRDYLVAQGVAERSILIDPAADHTPQTCIHAKAMGIKAPALFVSQRFHLPRIAFQCRLRGFSGIAVAPDHNASRKTAPLGDKIWYRGIRFARENLLIWMTIFGLYPA